MAPNHSQRAIKAAYLFGLLSGSSIAQSLPDTIVGCDTVDCPINDNSTSANCTLVDKTYSAVGLARIPVDSDSPFSGFSWLEGIAVEDDGNNRTFERNFYLGTPPDANVSDVAACALFFTSTSDRVKFDGQDTEETEGTCEDALSKDCVEALNKRAKEVDVDGLSPKASCSKVQKALSDNLDSACSSFAGGSKWTNVTAQGSYPCFGIFGNGRWCADSDSKALFGSGAPGAISSRENSTSNCWPITPKSDDLTLIGSLSSKGDLKAETLEAAFYGIVPILTVFFPGNSSVITEADSQMTCMKAVGKNDATEQTKSDSDDDENRAPALRFPSTTLVGITSFFALAAVLL
ncbi:Fc.00g041690.m01.CDS01 [Cosmosporella sp. VM-42]